LIRRPFQRGDQIKVGDIEGTVQAVETRATLVKTYSGRLVIIPNSDIYTRSVTVHTQRGSKKPAPVKEPTPAEEARDPEAEKPKRGELNEGVEELPR